MAALERYYLSRGLNVAGYDRTPSALTAKLAEEGVQISYDDSMDAVPEAFRNPADTLVIYTPAVPASNTPLTFFHSGGFNIIKRAAALGMITRGSKAICFAGTHGKTTTSSMCAHILHCGHAGCNAFLGGILRNYGSNLLLSATSPYSVVIFSSTHAIHCCNHGHRPRPPRHLRHRGGLSGELRPLYHADSPRRQTAAAHRAETRTRGCCFS